MALPQMRPMALTMPVLTEGDVSSPAQARPRASDHWPTLISFLGVGAGTGKPIASIFSRVSIRVVSVATILATWRSLCPGTETKIADGLLAKLNALEMM